MSFTLIGGKVACTGVNSTVFDVTFSQFIKDGVSYLIIDS